MAFRVHSAPERYPESSRWRWGRLAAWWAFCLAVLALGGGGILYLRGRPPTAARIAAARKQGVPFDQRTPFAYFLELRKKNPQAVPVFPVSMRMSLGGSLVRLGGDEVFPLAGVANAETLYCNENGY